MQCWRMGESKEIQTKNLRRKLMASSMFVLGKKCEFPLATTDLGFYLESFLETHSRRHKRAIQCYNIIQMACLLQEKKGEEDVVMGNSMLRRFEPSSGNPPLSHMQTIIHTNLYFRPQTLSLITFSLSFRLAWNLFPTFRSLYTNTYENNFKRNQRWRNGRRL